MMRAILMLVVLSGCASERDGVLRAWLAPFCIINCFVGVTYAPGVEWVTTAPRINH